MPEVTRDPYAARVLDAAVTFIPRRLARPMKLSTATITEVTEARVIVTVDVAGRTAEGRGSVYLSDQWAWPDQAIPHSERDQALRDLTLVLADGLPALLLEPSHPLELGLRLAAALPSLSVPGPLNPPLLARIVCGSPFDAAIHDGVGIAVDRSAFDLFDEAILPTADRLFPDGGARRAISAMLASRRRGTLDAWWVVGADDAPEDLGSAVATGGFRCFKLKVRGAPVDDVALVARVHAAAVAAGVNQPVISVDYNGACRSAEPVIEFLDRLEGEEPAAYAALSYLEQPVPAALIEFPADWRVVGRRKPVIADEGLTTVDALATIEAQGWSGVALKTAKGHSLCVVSAAWALERTLSLSFQDLTNPGIAAIHTALFAARLPTINGAEINSPQFTPEANAAWLPRLSGLFQPRDGVHVVPPGPLPGLGSTA